MTVGHILAPHVGSFLAAEICQPGHTCTHKTTSYAGIPLGMLAQPYPAMPAFPRLAMSAWPISVDYSLGQPFIMSLGHALTLPGVIPR
jgi:hypothetical protein